jgi:hypothetical protein
VRKILDTGRIDNITAQYTYKTILVPEVKEAEGESETAAI